MCARRDQRLNDLAPVGESGVMPFVRKNGENCPWNGAGHVFRHVEGRDPIPRAMPELDRSSDVPQAKAPGTSQHCQLHDPPHLMRSDEDREALPVHGTDLPETRGNGWGLRSVGRRSRQSHGAPSPDPLGQTSHTSARSRQGRPNARPVQWGHSGHNSHSLQALRDEVGAGERERSSRRPPEDREAIEGKLVRQLADIVGPVQQPSTRTSI